MNGHGIILSQSGQVAVGGVQFAIAVLAALSSLVFLTTAADAGRLKTDQIRFEYVPPKNPEHLPIYEQLKKARALERVKVLLSPLRLPRPLPIKVVGCDGVSDAWYDESLVTLCYEFLDEIVKNAPAQALPIGVTKLDAILGPFLDLALHEAGHAVFDYLKIPVLGREEDAADTFSAYIMLQFGDSARRLIAGTAYQYQADMQNPQVSMALKTFSDSHGTGQQRFFNVLCLAYGGNQKLFADVVEKGYLPKDRAEGCEDEYKQAKFALEKLIGPYVDKPKAKAIQKSWIRDLNQQITIK